MEGPPRPRRVGRRRETAGRAESMPVGVRVRGTTGGSRRRLNPPSSGLHPTTSGDHKDVAENQGLCLSARAPSVPRGMEGPRGSWLGQGVLWAPVPEDCIGLSDLGLTERLPDLKGTSCQWGRWTPLG